jgi:hypothetical protein
MNLLFTTLGLNVLLIFFLKRDWLLNNKSFLILIALNLVLFILGFILQHEAIGDPKFVVLLKIPLIYQLLFFAMATIFRKIYHRDPVDTFWSMDRHLMRDGIFNFVFVVLLFVIFLFLY